MKSKKNKLSLNWLLNCIVKGLHEYMVSFVLYFLSREYLNIASVILNVIIGINKDTVTFIKSDIPYSSVDKNAV